MFDLLQKGRSENISKKQENIKKKTDLKKNDLEIETIIK